MRLDKSRVKPAGTSPAAPSALSVSGAAPRLAGEIFSENSTVKGVTTTTFSALWTGVVATTRGAKLPRVRSTVCADNAGGIAKAAAAPSPLAKLLARTVAGPGGAVRK